MRSLRRSKQGVSTIEFSILSPVLFLFLLGIVDCGYALFTQQALYHGAQFAARCGALQSSSCSTTAQIKSTAAANSLGLSPPASSFTVSDATCGKLVTASYPYRPFSVLTSKFAVTLTARGCFLNYA